MRKRLKGQPVPSIYESALLGKDGKVIPVEVMGARTLWKGKAATIGMLRDITEHKRLDNELRRSELLLREAQRIAGLGCFEWNAGSNRLFWSDQMYRIYGVKRGEFIVISALRALSSG